MNKINEKITTMVVVPQEVWEGVVQTINEIKERLVINNLSQQATLPAIPERIPIVLFKNNKQLSMHYGLGYYQIRELSLKGKMRTYCDENHSRGRWTTHDDIICYLNSIRHKDVTNKQ